MKGLLATFLALIALSAVATLSRADIEGAPFLPESDARFDALEQGNHIPQGVYPAGSADGHYVKQYVKATYDFAKKGGSVGNINLGVSIPAKAIETRTFIYSITKPTTSASGTLAFGCANLTNADLKQSTVVASYGAADASVDGTQSGAASNFSTVATKCNINAIIGTGALTAGKVVVYVEYLVHQ